MRWGLISVIVLMLMLGFSQEMLKVNINYYLDISSKDAGFFERSPEARAQFFIDQKIDAPGDYYHSHRQLNVLHHLSESEIGMFKWGAALLFIILNVALCYFALRFSGAAEMVNWLFVVTGSAICLALVFFFFSRMASEPVPMYHIARKFLGFAQSPLPALILWFTSKLKSID